MQTDTIKYWPFEVIPADKRTERHRKEVQFFETAFQEGFRPGESSVGAYRANSDRGRQGWIIYRGRVRRDGPYQWEVWLVEADDEVVACWVDEFDCAADAVLQWLRGFELKASLTSSQQHFVKSPYPHPPIHEHTEVAAHLHSSPIV